MFEDFILEQLFLSDSMVPFKGKVKAKGKIKELTNYRASAKNNNDKAPNSYGLSDSKLKKLESIKMK